jgi:hypothetical protein
MKCTLLGIVTCVTPLDVNSEPPLVAVSQDGTHIFRALRLQKNFARSCSTKTNSEFIFFNYPFAVAVA